MATYSTQTSDKSRKKAIKLLLCEGVGLHLFYVGKIKAGIVRFIIGLFVLLLAIVSLFTRSDAISFIIYIVILIGLNLSDLIKLLLGTFRDNIGNHLGDNKTPQRPLNRLLRDFLLFLIP